MKFNKKSAVTSCVAVFLSAALIAGCKPIFDKKPLPPNEDKEKVAAPAPAPATPAPAPAPAPTESAVPDKIENVESIETLESTAVNEEGSAETELVADDGGDIVKPDSAMMRNIQQALINAGFNPGPADGKSGAKTTAALQAFQKQNGIPAGNVDKRTLRALGVAF
ncbi:MAG: peptidoglycan-binding protein [Nitrosomonas sp.]|nr:MAG: peptidoglycan-binding protein [Nitrosomonas sp.]